jgi:hypothetical protein
VKRFKGINRMKIFISWSGQRSKAVALELHQWLRDVIQTLEPWMSAVDIEAGARWSVDVAAKLQETKFGIICVTKENLSAPWLLFEAGALAKTLSDTFVCPYLIGLEPSDIPGGPLTQFQAKRSNKKETWELLCSINNAMKEEKLPQEQLTRYFERWWPDLEAKLAALPEESSATEESRPTGEMIEEILDAVRSLSVRRGSEGRLLQNQNEMLRLLRQQAELPKDRTDTEWHIITSAINTAYQVRRRQKDVVMKCYDSIEKQWQEDGVSPVTALMIALLDEITATEEKFLDDSDPFADE